MKKEDFIKMIQDLVPDGAEVLITSSDDILGYYHYNDPYIHEVDALEYRPAPGIVSYEATYSNGVPTNTKKARVWIVE